MLVLCDFLCFWLLIIEYFMMVRLYQNGMFWTNLSQTKFRMSLDWMHSTPHIPFQSQFIIPMKLMRFLIVFPMPRVKCHSDFFF